MRETFFHHASRFLFRNRIDIALVYAILIFSIFYFFAPDPFSLENALAGAGLVMIFAGSYLLNRACDITEDRISQTEEAARFADRRELFIISGILFVLPFALAPILILFGLKVLPIEFLIFIPLSLLYSYPLFKGKRAKDIFILKNIYAAFSWHLSALFLFIFYLEFPAESVIGRFFYLFFIILAYEILWDIKDVAGDKKARVKTIPDTWGLPATRLVLSVILLLALALSYWAGAYVSIITTLYLFVWTFLLSARTSLWVYHAIFLGQALIMLLGLL